MYQFHTERLDLIPLFSIDESFFGSPFCEPRAKEMVLTDAVPIADGFIPLKPHAVHVCHQIIDAAGTGKDNHSLPGLTSKPLPVILNT
mgnify:CR=1 FL=1